MGNSLDSAHLGRQCRLDPLIFCCSSQPATAVATSHLPSSHCTWLQPHSHSSPTLGPWPMQSYLSSCPGVCQARRRQRGPNICSLNIYSVASPAPATAPATGNDPQPSRQLAGRQIIVQSLAPAHILSLCSPFLPPRNTSLLFSSPSGALLILRWSNARWKTAFLSFFFIFEGSECPCTKPPPTKVLLFFFCCFIRSLFHLCYIVLFGKNVGFFFRSARLNAAKTPIFIF